MIAFFEWFASLESYQAWMLFIGVSILMAITPYFSLLKRLTWLFFSREKPQIIDFSWRISPDFLIFEDKDKQLYYQSQSKYVFQGCPIILSWNVKGAYRIDVQPDFRDLKENSLIAIVKPTGNNFTLIAYTLKGKIEQNVTISDEQVLRLNTSNLGGSNAFAQPIKRIKESSLSEDLPIKLHLPKYSGLIFTKLSRLKGRLLGIDKISTIEPANKRIQYKSDLNSDKMQLNNYIYKQKIVKGFDFKPSKYNQVLNQNNKIK
jgi:hypothetical protein